MSLIVKPLNGLSNFFRETLEPALGKLVYGFGSVANGIGNQGRKVQSGSIGLYLFAFVIGVCAIIIYLFLAQNIA
jgi:NADH-quinone oxidoreductase subunit L